MKNFLESIGTPYWSKLDRVLKRLGDYGKILNKEQIRNIGESLFEVKGGKFRLVVFLYRGCLS